MSGHRVFTNRECEQACRREAWYRRRVYAAMVADGRLTQEAADRGITIMEQIMARYKTEADADDARAKEAIGQGSFEL